MKKPRPREDCGLPKIPQQLCFELTMYQLCGPAWEVAFGSVGPADSCVPSGNWNAGGRPVWPLHPDSPRQNQVALVVLRAQGWGALRGAAEYLEGEE